MALSPRNSPCTRAEAEPTRIPPSAPEATQCRSSTPAAWWLCTVTGDTDGGDVIRPALAALPDELCHLIADAIGDGDLDAALSYYEPDAVQATDTEAPAIGLGAIRQVLAGAVEAKLAYDVQVQRSLVIGEIALLAGRWSMRGTDQSGVPRAVFGTVSSIARRRPDRSWRVMAETLIRDTGPAPGVAGERRP